MEFFLFYFGECLVLRRGENQSGGEDLSSKKSEKRRRLWDTDQHGGKREWSALIILASPSLLTFCRCCNQIIVLRRFFHDLVMRVYITCRSTVWPFSDTFPSFRQKSEMTVMEKFLFFLTYPWKFSRGSYRQKFLPRGQQPFAHR